MQSGRDLFPGFLAIFTLSSNNNNNNNNNKYLRDGKALWHKGRRSVQRRKILEPASMMTRRSSFKMTFQPYRGYPHRSTYVYKGWLHCKSQPHKANLTSLTVLVLPSLNTSLAFSFHLFDETFPVTTLPHHQTQIQDGSRLTFS